MKYWGALLCLLLSACAQLPAAHHSTSAINVTPVAEVRVDPLSFQGEKMQLALPQPLPQAGTSGIDQMSHMSSSMTNAFSQLRRRFATQLNEDCHWNKRRDGNYLASHYKTMMPCVRQATTRFYTQMRRVMDAYSAYFDAHYRPLVVPRLYRLYQAAVNVTAAGSYDQERLLGNYMADYALIGNLLAQAPLRPDSSKTLGVRSTHAKLQAKLDKRVARLASDRAATQASILKSTASVHCLFTYCRPVDGARPKPTK